MPLVKDGAYRGTRAVHVRGHSKIVHHRTVITAAFDLVNWLVDSGDVRSVSLGIVAGGGGRTGYTPRVTCVVEGRKINVLLAVTNAAQVLRVKTRSLAAAERIAEEIKGKWEEVIRADAAPQTTSNVISISFRR